MWKNFNQQSLWNEGEYSWWTSWLVAHRHPSLLCLHSPFLKHLLQSFYTRFHSCVHHPTPHPHIWRGGFYCGVYKLWIITPTTTPNFWYLTFFVYFFWGSYQFTLTLTRGLMFGFYCLETQVSFECKKNISFFFLFIVQRGVFILLASNLSFSFLMLLFSTCQ